MREQVTSQVWLESAELGVGTFLAGVIIGWAVRRRSLLLPFVSVVYACLALALGFIAESTYWLSLQGQPVSFETAYKVTNTLLILVRFDWAYWVVAAVAALPAFVLPLVRAVRLRRRPKPSDDSPQQEEQQQQQQPEAEPEYRGSFEPFQPPAPRPTGNLFTPRDESGQA
ncbi:hypothetical protein [Nonomuraea rhizosphaerae]|uniref:hypothetical protein n=1 Tax=Nonomuraea rhizosphaerae TaxID=2665663 RepID=UPI001C5EBE56|nr:hypothetical protein [Nonomuraea rhizosphaerae]